MARWVLLALAVYSLQAAFIRGIVVEHQSGRPLSHAVVVCAPVAGTPGTVQSAQTGNTGAFEFPSLSAGAYLISASRRGLAPAHFGQKQFRGAGVPIVLDEAASRAISIRLPRFGSITGVVADENDVGMPEHDVVAYRNTRPPQIAGRARTDDRGVYRIFGLEPGSYLVRALAKQYEEEGYLPTFSRETPRVGDARAYEVLLDQQTADAHIRPFPGRLVTVAGRLTPYPGAPVIVSLISDAGTETAVTDARGEFQFKPVAPGPYELFAQAAMERRYGGGAVAGYQSLAIDRDRQDLRLSLAPLPVVQIEIADSQGRPVEPATVQILARRRDLSAEGQSSTLRIPPGGITLLPGRWELTMAWMPGYYVASFSGPRAGDGEGARADGWNEILPPAGTSVVKFVLSPNPGALHGVVTSNRAPVAGAPVFLEAYDVESRRRLTDLRIAHTDMKGEYHFYGLVPGNYRILSSFDYQTPDSAALDLAGARVIKAEESRDLAQNLELYILP